MFSPCWTGRPLLAAERLYAAPVPLLEAISPTLGPMTRGSNPNARATSSLFGLAGLAACAWLASFQDPVATAPEAVDGAGRGQAMAVYAKGFLNGLSERAKELATTTFDAPERRTWAFGPVQREGIKLGELALKDLALLEALLDTALSPAGMEAWHEVRELENVLRKLESTPEKTATHRDPDLYWLRIYGEPDPRTTWSWRFEGHHFALHVTCKPGLTPSVTPFFLGASPLIGPGELSGSKSTRVAAFTGLNTELQRLVAMLDEDAAKKVQPSLSADGPKKRPGDIRMGPGQPKLPAASGASLSELPPEAAAQVGVILQVYLDLLDPELRTFWIDSLDPEAVHFARWGGTGLDEARTWSILTETFAFEVATTDGPAHIHALLRDVKQDFGGE